jgi:hypothetical protein
VGRGTVVAPASLKEGETMVTLVQPVEAADLPVANGRVHRITHEVYQEMGRLGLLDGDLIEIHTASVEGEDAGFRASAIAGTRAHVEVADSGRVLGRIAVVDILA